MKVKINKDALLKHRFWIMLGVAATLAVTSIAYLELLYGGPVEAKKTLMKAYTEGKGRKGTQNPATIEAMTKLADESVKRETELWAKNYRDEKELFKWADPVEEKFNFYDGNFAVKIDLSKLPPDVKSWPEDKQDLMHGTITRFDEEGFFLKNRKGEVHVNRTESVNNVTLVEETKAIPYVQLNANHAGRLVAVTYQKGRYFNDILTEPEQRAFTGSYKDQIHEILKIVDPLDDKMNGVVQLREWLYKPAPDFPDEKAKFIRYVAEDWVRGKPISREAWIAQENLWIQKEIYRVISVANKELSVFQGQGGKERNKAYSFTNPNFQVELNLDAKGTLAFRIKNLLDRQQNIDMKFRVLLNETPGFAPETITISGLPLKPKGDAGGKDSYLQTIPAEKSPRNAVLSVQQILTWQTAAVKRIDQISIGSNGGIDEFSHSHRTYVDPLRPFDEKDKIEPKTGEGGGGGTFPTGGPRGGEGGGGRKFPMFPGMQGGGGGVGGLGANQGPLEHGLWTYRYVEVTPQSRRLPVAVALIVDQDHIDRVLTAFNNSKLRFLATQVLLNQYMGSLQPPVIEQKNGPGGGPPGYPGFQGGRFGPGEGGRGGFGQPNEPAVGGGQETNMEMVIYGIMTLYQRYPQAPRLPGAVEGEKR